MATLTSMERGTLSEEYRTGASADGGDPVRLGPYYKHQVWEGGRDLSRRVPPEQVSALKDNLANYQRFTALTRQRRSSADVQEDSAAAKKLREGSSATPPPPAAPAPSRGAAKPASF